MKHIFRNTCVDREDSNNRLVTYGLLINYFMKLEQYDKAESALTEMSTKGLVTFENYLHFDNFFLGLDIPTNYRAVPSWVLMVKQTIDHGGTYNAFVGNFAYGSRFGIGVSWTAEGVLVCLMVVCRWLDTGQKEIAYMPWDCGGHIDTRFSGMDLAISLMTHSCIVKASGKENSVPAPRELDDSSWISFPFDPGTLFSSLLLDLLDQVMFSVGLQTKPRHWYDSFVGKIFIADLFHGPLLCVLVTVLLWVLLGNELARSINHVHQLYNFFQFAYVMHCLPIVEGSDKLSVILKLAIIDEQAVPGSFEDLCPDISCNQDVAITSVAPKKFIMELDLMKGVTQEHYSDCRLLQSNLSPDLVRTRTYRAGVMEIHAFFLGRVTFFVQDGNVIFPSSIAKVGARISAVVEYPDNFLVEVHHRMTVLL